MGALARPLRIPGGAAEWGECSREKFSSCYSSLIRPDLQKNGIPVASRGPAAWLNPLPLHPETHFWGWGTPVGLGTWPARWHRMGTERGPWEPRASLRPLLSWLWTLLPWEALGLSRLASATRVAKSSQNHPNFPLPHPQRGCVRGHTVPRTITARSHPAPGRGRWPRGHTGCHPRMGARWVPAPPGCVLPAPSSRWDRADGVPKWLLERRGRARCAGTNRASQGFSDITTNPTNPRAALPRRLKINA